MRDLFETDKSVYDNEFNHPHEKPMKPTPPFPPFCPDGRPEFHGKQCPPPFPPFCPDDRPEYHGKPCPPPMPPVPSVVEGQDLYEAMNILGGRVNTCIQTYNAVMAENYKTLRNLQRAAEENGAYYDPCSVFVEEGWCADESAVYHLIHKKHIDSHGEPIRMQLHLAYGNTTNSGIKQNIFSASKVEYADKMLVAIPTADNGWYGNAIWHGSPIPSAEAPTLYTVGFTRAGIMRVYHNSASIDQMLRDTIENAMGCSGVLIQNGQLTGEAERQNIPDYKVQTSRVVIGQNMDTKEVIILTCGNENDVDRKGMTSSACAKILLEYGCDLAVELCEGKGSGAIDKGQLMYTPDDLEEPNAQAYWFISRKCYYHNDYERELAELVQNYGACLWQGFLNKKAIKKVKAELDAEIDRAKNAEKTLQDNIDKEQSRAEEAERVLQENIDKEQQRAEAEEDRLNKKIDAETERATSEEQRIEGRLNEEIERATTEEKRIDNKLDEEITRAKAEETRLDEKINAETKRAQGEELRLDNKIDEETHRATNEEERLHQEILTEQGERISADKVLQTNINTEASTRADADSQLQANIDAEATARQSEDAALRQLIKEEEVRAKTEESRLDEKIDTETTRATNRENEIESNLNKEIDRAKTKETEISTNLDTEIHNRETADENLHQEIQAVDGKLDALTIRVTECESDIVNLQTLTTTLQQQMSSLDATVAGMLQTVSDLEQTMNTLKQSINSINSTINKIVSGEIVLPYVRLKGDTMTGALHMADANGTVKGTLAQTDDGVGISAETGAFVRAGAERVNVGDNDGADVNIRGVADPVEDNDATPKSWVQKAIDAINTAIDGLKGIFVKKSGDTMAGDLAFDFDADQNYRTKQITYTKDGDTAYIRGEKETEGGLCVTISGSDADRAHEAVLSVGSDSVIVGVDGKETATFYTDALDMYAHKITNVGAGELNTDGVNLGQVKTLIPNVNGFVKKTGDTMTGSLRLSQVNENYTKIYFGKASVYSDENSKELFIENETSDAQSIEIRMDDATNEGNNSGSAIKLSAGEIELCTIDTINGGLTKVPIISLTKNSVNANNYKITNVAEGINDSDGVNLAQVKALIGSTGSGDTVKSATVVMKPVETVENGKTVVLDFVSSTIPADAKFVFDSVGYLSVGKTTFMTTLHAISSSGKYYGRGIITGVNDPTSPISNEGSLSSDSEIEFTMLYV